jgi:ribosomal protein S18 acetylase RimI-like enzyme
VSDTVTRVILAPVLEVRPLDDNDRPWAVEVEADSWGEPVVARLGELVDPTGLPGFVAWLDARQAGLITYAVREDECEVVTIRSLEEGRGIARALLDAVRDAAVEAACKRLWLVTTNNNLRALGVFQRWGLDLVALRRNGVTEARRQLKPSIPERDRNGIPIAHELVLELRL